MEHIGVAEQSLTCLQYIFIVIDQIGHISIQYNGQFDLRMPVPGELSCVKPGQPLVTDQHRKGITAMGFQFFLCFVNFQSHISQYPSLLCKYTC